MHKSRWFARAFFALLLAGCSGAETSKLESSGLDGFEQPAPGELGAQVASYEIMTGKPQRVSVGLVRGGGELIGYGNVTMDFAFVGDGTTKIDQAPVTATVDAPYVLVAGHEASPDRSGPRIINPSDGIGVYRAEVAFDRPGTWLVQVTAKLAAGNAETQATFEVFDEDAFPAPGDEAPKTENRVAGDSSVEASVIDSRASADTALPDPELHNVTIADAIAARRPVMVVVSTPVYCVSRFCGPITDTVSQLAKTHDNAKSMARGKADGMVFVHLEVWNDFADNAMNKDAAEWIKRQDREIQEPWVFVIGRDGRIIERFDNIVTQSDLTSAVAAATT